MKADLAKLIALQDIDRQLHELEVSTRQFPERVAELEGQVAVVRKAVSDLEGRQTQTEQERAAIIAAAQEADEGLQRSQERLSSITTNREYDAIHTEIATREQAKQSAKGRLQALEDDDKKLGASIEEARGNAAKFEQEHGPQISELHEKIATIDAQRQALMARRQEALAAIPGPVLRTYERIRKRRAGSDVLSFVGPQARSCACCHMVLQPQLLSDLRTGVRLTTCQSCGSILVWQDATAAPAPGAG
jgi:predicted  nucleic acid-binding Zn-ribbon protein